MKRFIPKSIRLNYKLSSRFINDLVKGNLSKFAKSDRKQIRYNGMIETQQPIYETHLVENKIHNLKIATKEIGLLQVHPGEIFSFWKAVGKPSKGKGYKTGRNLINSQLTEDTGGGLCQLAGIIYHTSLKAGLEIVERHSHSVDIYDEDQRYTPLGADAAVVYGYKDLRIKNPRGFLVKYSFIVKSDNISCRVFLEDNVMQNKVEFKRVNGGTKEMVATIVTDFEGNRYEVGVSEYPKKD
jgi:vancomycin resistance protein VanW